MYVDVKAICLLLILLEKKMERITKLFFTNYLFILKFKVNIKLWVNSFFFLIATTQYHKEYDVFKKNSKLFLKIK